MHSEKRKPAVVLSLLLMSLLLSACSAGQTVSETDNAVPEAEDANGQKTLETAAAPEETEQETAYHVGNFTMEDIHGQRHTQDMFQDYDLTMVNVFATWCSPCIAEIPYLEQLSQDMAGQGVGVVGIVLDAADGEGGVDEDALDAARTLAEELGTTYPFLIPDAGLMNGLLTGIQSIPTTFFVDSEGNLTGYAYVGSRSLEDWTEIAANELSLLGEAQ